MSHFQNDRHKFAVQKSNYNSRPKNALKRYLITNLSVQNLLSASKFKMAAKFADKSCFSS